MTPLAGQDGYMQQCFIEHNETLNTKEVNKIKQIVSLELAKLRMCNQNGKDL